MLLREDKKRILEKRFIRYFRRQFYIKKIDYEIRTLPTVVSCGRWLVKVDTGTYSSPTEWHVEELIRLEKIRARWEESNRDTAAFENFLRTRFPELHDLFLLRYRDNETPEQISDELHVSRRTYFRQVERLLNCAMQYDEMHIVDNLALKG